ncbi:hypothetical protein [Proteiniborus sp. MB09-C3]|uniref:hypothetical protein n=1 Tax=Proteiniborus sp. MB09-C3 TaxID=3050072 RepID=UPI002553CABF|nr:hypothetical protein [Proteiniborus sp. MB09-C3]WIV10375.1 hypothetical protein QO263_09375 [Proteiniborus sp. MB09-C3]
MKRISIILILTVFLSGCSSTQSVSYDFNNNYEGIVQKDGYMTNFEYASTDRCTYYFEDNAYSDEQKNEFINDFEKIFDYVTKDMKATIDLPINIYVANKLFVQGKDKSIFLNDINAKNINSINAFFQGIVGSTPNYGLGYGLSLYVYEKVFKDTYKPENEIAMVSEYLSDEKNLDILDLEVPVFEEVYFTKEDNTYAHDIAYYLTKDIIKQKGVEYAFELFNKSKDLDITFEKEYEVLANDWLKRIGAQVSYKATNVPLRYEKNVGRNIKIYPYIIQSPSTESYIELGFTLTNDVDIFSMDYGYIKYFFELFEKDVKSLKETDIFSKYLETPEEKPICQFREKISNIKLGGGIVHNYNEQITIEYRDPLYAGVHEYAHYLAIKSNKPRAGWLEEGFAVYCEHYLADRGVYRLMYESWGDFNNAYNNFLDSAKPCKQFYEKLVNDKPPFKRNEINLYALCEALAFHATIDKRVYTTLGEYRMGMVGDIPEGLDLTYHESGSLVNYLIETYGEEKLCELLKNYDRLYGIYGKTFKELCDEWYLALKAKFE